MKRSNCPISNTLDHLGDKWSLLILRDIILYKKSTFKSLQESEERIATNILSDRLLKLEKSEIIVKKKHPKDKRRLVYEITDKGLDLLPLLIEMIMWSKKYYPETYTPDDFYTHLKEKKEAVIHSIIDDIRTSRSE